MILLIDICELNWVPIFLSWLLPFLLGIGLGRLIWGPYKIRSFDQGKELVKYKGRVNELNADYQTCQKARTQLEGEAAVLRGRIKELESYSKSAGKQKPRDITNLKQKEVKSNKSDEGQESVSSADVNYESIPDSNLQVIDGIGPKLESLLKSEGLNSWTDIASRDPEELLGILTGIDPKYRIINTASWPLQAQMASENKWDKLVEFQRNIPDGQEGEGHVNQAKVERYLVESGIIKEFEQDDLKAIEGIGPKIEELLQNHGIDSWKNLADIPVDKLQEILDSRGDRFKLANPMTWPTQARLAYLGEWDQLKALKEKLIRGV